MSDLTREERAAIAARHCQRRRDDTTCAADRQPWPCDAARLRAALTAAEARARQARFDGLTAGKEEYDARLNHLVIERNALTVRLLAAEASLTAAEARALPTVERILAAARPWIAEWVASAYAEGETVPAGATDFDDADTILEIIRHEAIALVDGGQQP